MISPVLFLTGFGEIVNTKSGTFQTTVMDIDGKFLNAGTVTAEKTITGHGKCELFESSGMLKTGELTFKNEKTVIKLSPTVLVAVLKKGSNNLGGIEFLAQNDGNALLKHTMDGSEQVFVRETSVLEKALQEGLGSSQNAQELREHLQKNA